MQNQKIIILVQKKLQKDQIILSIQKITYLNKNNKKIQDFLTITNRNLFFIQANSIKKIINLKQFKYLTLAILSTELIFHFQKQWIRIQSQSNVKIIANILMAKQKFIGDKTPLMINLQMEKSLQYVFSQSNNSKSFWKIFSNKKEITQNSRKSQTRESFTTIEVNQKNFIFQIGKKMYQSLFKNTSLLYSNGAMGFRFDWENYENEQSSIYQAFYWKKQNKQNRILRRKIPKSTLAEDESIRKMLKSYKMSQYSEEVFFCIQTQTHFQVISPYSLNCISCLEYIQQNKCLDENTLKKIFHQLYNFISDDNKILVSLNVNNIYLIQNQVKISTIFCKIPRIINVNALCPEQLEKMSQIDNNFSENQIFKINLWKLGIILFELSYWKLPFPIDYLASKIVHNQTFKIHFPDYDKRTIQFQHFIKSLLCKDPIIRGNKLKGQVRSSIINPNLTNILYHDWILSK